MGKKDTSIAICKPSKVSYLFKRFSFCGANTVSKQQCNGKHSYVVPMRMHHHYGIHFGCFFEVFQISIQVGHYNIWPDTILHQCSGGTISYNFCHISRLPDWYYG